MFLSFYFPSSSYEIHLQRYLLTESLIIETVGWLRNATAAYCGLSGTPVNSTYASVNAEFFDPPE